MVAALEEDLRDRIDWSAVSRLRIKARRLSDGVFAGVHRSTRRGSGVEFGGMRSYTPGDDLRLLDKRALLRYDRLAVRQFETENDRSVRFLVDATRSMGYGGEASKWHHAALLCAALARICLRGGDPVGLTFFGGKEATSLPPRSGFPQWERMLGVLASSAPWGDAVSDPALFRRALGSVLCGARPGSAVVLVSDFLDLPEGVTKDLTSLATHGRRLVCTRLLHPDERTFPFQGTVRLRALEGAEVLDADADGARARYLARLLDDEEALRRTVVARGGEFVPLSSSDPPVESLRKLLFAL